MKIISEIIWRNIAGIIVAVILSVFLFRSCEEKKLALENVNALTLENKSFKNALGTMTMSNSTLQLSKKELQKTVIEKDKKLESLTKKFNSIKSFVTLKTNTVIDTIQVPYKVPVPFGFDREGSKSAEWYSFDYKSDSTGITLKNFQIPNEIIVITGFKRKNIFSPLVLTTEVTNTNKLIQNVDVKSYQTVVPKKWYESKLLWFAGGFIGGTLLVK